MGLFDRKPKEAIPVESQEVKRVRTLKEYVDETIESGKLNVVGFVDTSYYNPLYSQNDYIGAMNDAGYEAISIARSHYGRMCYLFRKLPET